MLNISRSKGNQTMKLGQLIEYRKRNIFLQKLCRNWGRETSSIFWKSLICGKSRWSPTYLQYISVALNFAYNKSQMYKTFDYPEKGPELVSLPHFVYDFSRKMFLMLHSINWPNFIVWLALLLKILGNICITIVC